MAVGAAVLHFRPIQIVNDVIDRNIAIKYSYRSHSTSCQIDSFVCAMCHLDKLCVCEWICVSFYFHFPVLGVFLRPKSDRNKFNKCRDCEWPPVTIVWELRTNLNGETWNGFNKHSVICWAQPHSCCRSNNKWKVQTLNGMEWSKTNQGKNRTNCIAIHCAAR